MRKLLTLSLFTCAISMGLYAKSQHPFFNNINVGILLSNSESNKISIFRIFSTEDFKNEKLALVYGIFHQTSRTNIDEKMKQKGFTVDEPYLIDDAEYGDILMYSSVNNLVQVEYHLNGKIASVTVTYKGAPNNIFVEMELGDAGFKSEDGGKMYGFEEGENKKYWKKSSDTNTFVTFSNDEEKIGIVAYGLLEE